ncbi:hypothetical protein KEM55_006671 [Ascosphaera atra]|nr:hypothetical protein KEM55_006671 [Ascosphaera atra]
MHQTESSNEDPFGIGLPAFSSGEFDEALGITEGSGAELPIRGQTQPSGESQTMTPVARPAWSGVEEGNDKAPSVRSGSVVRSSVTSKRASLAPGTQSPKKKRVFKNVYAGMEKKIVFGFMRDGEVVEKRETWTFLNNWQLQIMDSWPNLQQPVIPIFTREPPLSSTWSETRVTCVLAQACSEKAEAACHHCSKRGGGVFVGCHECKEWTAGCVGCHWHNSTDRCELRDQSQAGARPGSQKKVPTEGVARMNELLKGVRKNRYVEFGADVGKSSCEGWKHAVDEAGRF